MRQERGRYSTEETQISFYLFLLNENKHIGSGTWERADVTLVCKRFRHNLETEQQQQQIQC